MPSNTLPHLIISEEFEVDITFQIGREGNLDTKKVNYIIHDYIASQRKIWNSDLGFLTKALNFP